MINKKLDDNKHKRRHKLLHKHLDELVTDFIQQTENKFPSKTTILELIEWSYGETK